MVVFGKGYAPVKMPLVVLVRLEAGDGATGEKYDSGARGNGEVSTVSGAAGGTIGKRGGGTRAVPAIEWALSLVAERWRKLVLEALRCIVPGIGAGALYREGPEVGP